MMSSPAEPPEDLEMERPYLNHTSPLSGSAFVGFNLPIPEPVSDE